MGDEGRTIFELSGKAVAAGIAFFVITSLTITWSRFGGGLALLWPGSAILTALLVTLPKNRWLGPIALFGVLSTVATALFGFGPKVALPLALINIFEGAIIARLLADLRPRSDWLQSVPGLEGMIFGVVVGTCLAAAPGGVLAWWMVGGAWHHHTLDWLVSHTLGSLLCFPLAYMFISGLMRDKVQHGSVRNTMECAAHCAAIALFCWIAFFQTSMALLFLPIVPLMYAAFRAGRVGAILGLIIVAAMGGASLQSEIGFFNQVQWSLTTEVQFLQFYLAILLTLALPLSVALKQHKLVMAELEEKRALERLVADNSDDVLINLDASGCIRYCSPAGLRLMGGVDPTGQSLSSFFEPLDETLVRMTLMLATEDTEATQVLERAVIRDEEILWLETKIRAVRGANSAAIAGFAVTIRDVTTRRAAEMSAVREAETDALTGLPNRRALMRHLDPRLERAESRALTMAIIDLDLFKEINDTHGHDVGDTVLREVALAMRKVSSPGLFFARLGGEEFALVIEQTSLSEAVEVAASVHRAIGMLRFTGANGANFQATASIGLARIDRPVSASEALRLADIPLYTAKANGRDRIEIGSVNPEDHRQERKFRAA